MRACALQIKLYFITETWEHLNTDAPLLPPLSFYDSRMKIWDWMIPSSSFYTEGSVPNKGVSFRNSLINLRQTHLMGQHPNVVSMILTSELTSMRTL